MQSKVEQYRTNVAECQKKAKEAFDPRAKDEFDEAAREWLVMAEQAERHDVLKRS